MDFTMFIQHNMPLVKLLQQWQNKLDNSGFLGTILMDLSMTAYHMNSIIAKLEAYDFIKRILSLLLD